MSGSCFDQLEVPWTLWLCGLKPALLFGCWIGCRTEQASDIWVNREALEDGETLLYFSKSPSIPEHGALTACWVSGGMSGMTSWLSHAPRLWWGVCVQVSECVMVTALLSGVQVSRF